MDRSGPGGVAPLTARRLSTRCNEGTGKPRRYGQTYLIHEKDVHTLVGPGFVVPCARCQFANSIRGVPFSSSDSPTSVLVSELTPRGSSTPGVGTASTSFMACGCLPGTNSGALAESVVEDGNGCACSMGWNSGVSAESSDMAVSGLDCSNASTGACPSICHGSQAVALAERPAAGFLDAFAAGFSCPEEMTRADTPFPD
mmetsp:Transcript_48579/g.125219  ORF Transcript_48579/g.125219 Transcript_48579/m.125219 type:complete len:200 (+) Transcript_48579:407-1006(+)